MPTYLSYTMYGKRGAIRFTPANDGVFIQVAAPLPSTQTQTVTSGISGRRYDWENGIKIKFGIDDILKLIGLSRMVLSRKEINAGFYHDHNGHIKRIDIVTREDQQQHRVRYDMVVRHKRPGDAEYITLAAHELTLSNLIFMTHVLPIWVYRLLNWDSQINQAPSQNVETRTTVNELNTKSYNTWDYTQSNQTSDASNIDESDEYDEDTEITFDW